MRVRHLALLHRLVRIDPPQLLLAHIAVHVDATLAHDRDLTLAEGTVLAIRSAGAYGFVQSSNYNARNRAAEVMVDGASFSIVRRRETIADQLRAEVASSAPDDRAVPQRTRCIS